MRFVMLYHSLVSDWNHGNAHFLRGVVRALGDLGHEVVVYEPRDGWSLTNLLTQQGPEALAGFAIAYPELQSRFYDPTAFDLDKALAGADVVIAHEWNPPALLEALATHRRRARYRLLFHDTHHRAVSDASAIGRLPLEGFDAVLAFGASLRQIYQSLPAARGGGVPVFTWHEAADTRHFYPRPEPSPKDGDVVFIGNGGDGEREAELEEFLIEPARTLGLRGRVYGVRYSPDALERLQAAGMSYGGWLPNFEVPSVFARYRVTVHIPRRQYAQALPGIPTIRPFEALACGIPLVSAFWHDSERLFVAGRDYLLANDGAAMKRHLSALLSDPARARAVARAGLEQIRARHSCAHRALELLRILAALSERASGRAQGQGQGQGDDRPPDAKSGPEGHAAGGTR